MVKRSLQVYPAEIQSAKRTFAIKRWAQENLAGEVNFKIHPLVWRFFTKQPVDRQTFLVLRSILDLDWQENCGSI